MRLIVFSVVVLANSFLLKWQVEASSHASGYENPESFLSSPFEPLTMPAIVQKVSANHSKITLLSTNEDEIFSTEFGISLPLLRESFPFDSEKNIFIFPEIPNNSTLSKLIYILTANSKTLSATFSVIGQYTHQQSLSVKMFKDTLNSFQTLAILHKSIMAVDPEITYYNQFMATFLNVYKILADFIIRFTSSILLDRICDNSALKYFVTSNIDGIFYLLQYVHEDDVKACMIDLLFSTVTNCIEERSLWAYYKRSASPFVFIPIPLHYLITYDMEILSTLSEDLLEIFSMKGPFNPLWLDQFGTLIRLKMFSEEEILKISELIVPFFQFDCLQLEEYLLNFVRLVFLSELNQPDCPNVAINYNPKRVNVMFSQSFYETLWRMFIIHNPIISNSFIENNCKFFNDIFQHLDKKYPHFNLGCIFSTESDESALQFAQTINDLPISLSDDGNIDVLIEFIQNDILPTFELFSFKSAHFRSSVILAKLVNIIEAVGNSHVEDPTKLKILIENVGAVLSRFIGFAQFFPFLNSFDEIKPLIDFAFVIDDFNQAQNILELVLLKLEKDEMYPTLLGNYFEIIAQNLSNRPDFFALQFDIRMFEELSSYEVIAQFLESIKDYIRMTSHFTGFLSNAYIHNTFDKDLLFFYLDKLITDENEFENFQDQASIFAFFSSFCDISYIYFPSNFTEEFYQTKYRDTADISIKCLQVLIDLVEKSRGFQLKYVAYISLISWMSINIAAFNTVRPEITSENQFDDMSLDSSSLELADGSSLVFARISDFNFRIIHKLLHSGASTDDLKTLALYIVECSERIKDLPLVSNIMTSTFTVLVLILRADETIFPISFISNAMNTYKFSQYKVCAPQLLYNSIESSVIRADLIECLFSNTFRYLDNNFIMDTLIFKGFSDDLIRGIFIKFINETFSAEAIHRDRLNAISFWMSRGLIPVDVANQILLKLVEPREQAIFCKNGITMLRAVFNCPKYESLRKFAVDNLLLTADHSAISPRPFILGMIGSIFDLFGEPEIEATFHCRPTSKKIMDYLTICQSELKRFERVTDYDALYLSQGIGNVLSTYNQALIDIYSFNMSLPRKTILFKSITLNLTRLVYQNGKSDFILEEFAQSHIDEFVRVSIFLAIQIFADVTGPMFFVELELNTLELFFHSIVLYVRDSNVQSLLFYFLFETAVIQSNLRPSLLECLPKYFNYHRFIMMEEIFNFIFAFNNSVERFDRFMNEIIESAFNVFDYTELDAIDMSRDPALLMKVHTNFFGIMNVLIQKYNLPAKYVLKTLTLMNENSELIELFSTSFVDFLRTAIRTRPTIDPTSSLYLRTINSYGNEQRRDHKEEILREIYSFLISRPDFVDYTVMPSTRVYQFILELRFKGGNIDLSNHPTIQMIRSFFDFPKTNIDSLQSIYQVTVPSTTSKHLAMWFSKSQSSAHENIVPLAILALNLIPSVFDLDSFTSVFNSSCSWVTVTASIIEWISNIATLFPVQLAQNIDRPVIEKFLNALLWQLEYDGTETFVSGALLNFMDALSFANESYHHCFVSALESKNLKSLTNLIRENVPVYIKMSSILRLWSSKSTINLESYIQELIWNLFDTKISFSEDEVRSTRQVFRNYLELIEGETVKISNITDILPNCRETIVVLRLMNEMDLVVLFIRSLRNLCSRFLVKIPSPRLSQFTEEFANTLYFLNRELLLQAKTDIFVDFYVFIFKHAVAVENRESIMTALDLLSSQIRIPDDIGKVLLTSAFDVTGNSCLMCHGLPAHFYENRFLAIQFINIYVNSLNAFIRKNSTLQIDASHFIFAFNLIHKIDGDAKDFKLVFESISQISGKDLINNEFAESFKAHCIKRPHLTDDTITSFINDSFVGAVFGDISSEAKGSIITAFKFMLKNNARLYQERVARLSSNLKVLMNSTVEAEFNDKKRQLVQRLVDRCTFPSADNPEEMIQFLSNLTTLLKVDISGILTTEMSNDFFNKLNDFLARILKTVLPTNQCALDIFAVAIALQVKNNEEVFSSAFARVLTNHNGDNLSAEVSNLLLEAIMQTDVLKLDEFFLPLLKKLIIKSSDPNLIIFKMYKKPKISLVTLELIENVENSLELQSAVSAIIFDWISNDLTGRFKNPGSDFNSFFTWAKSRNLLPKAQILFIENLIR